MEEIQKMHNLNLEWGCITNLMDRISTIESELPDGWPELVDMVADAVSEEGENKDPASAFFSLYQFLWRLYYRLRADSTKRTFNHIVRSKSDTGWGEQYNIYNYDYKTFKWARSHGFGMSISNNVLVAPKDKLTANEQRAFERRAGGDK